MYVPDGPLTPADIDHFIRHHFVVVRDCFATGEGSVAKRWCDEIWGRCGYDPQQPATWERERIHFNSTEHLPVAELAPKALAAMAQLVGGHDRIAGEPRWGNGLIVNFHQGADKPWLAPGPDAPGFHKDGDFFVHFLDSPEQGLLTLILWDDVVEKGGATYVAADSVPHVARFLNQHRGGLCPVRERAAVGLPEDMPSLPVRDILRQCREFHQATGKAGDVYLLHPFVLHAGSQNLSGRARIITNPPIHLDQPMQFRRDDGAYSVIEQCILNAIGVDALDYAPESPRQRIAGGAARVRDAEELERRARAAAQG